MSKKSENFNFFLPLTKIDKKQRTVAGYASTPALDLDGEVISLNAVKKALPGYWEWRNIREMHGPSAVGVAKEANVDETGLFLTAKIVDDDAWKKVEEGVYKGFSIGGRKLAKTGNTITEIELVEISVVDRPANPECRFEVQKRAKPGAAAILLKSAGVKKSPTQRALSKMAQAVEALAATGNSPGLYIPPSAHSEPPSRTSELETETPELAKGAMCDKHGKMSCKKCAKMAAKMNKKKKAATGVVSKREKKRIAALVAKYSAAPVELMKSESILPSFLVLGADLTKNEGGSARSTSKDFLELGATLHRKDGIITKGMAAAGSMSYCFDSLRSVQRQLLSEAKREGGDKKDKGLAQKVGSIASQLAEVIGQKAEHEGAEALDLSDADDQWLVSSLGEDFAMSKKGKSLGPQGLSDLSKAIVAELMSKAGGAEPTRFQRVKAARGEIKKARGSVKECMDAVKAAHGAHKAAYLAKQALVKAGKKSKKDDDDGDEFDHQDAMEKLQKAFGELQKVETFAKAANMQLKKAASRAGQGGNTEVDEGNEWYKVPAGVNIKTPADMSTASPGGSGSGSEPPLYPDDGGRYPGKMAKRLMKLSKNGQVPAALVEFISEAAALEAENAILSRQPANNGGRRPMTFDMTKFGGTGGNTQQSKDNAVIFKGVNPADINSEDENVRRKAVGQAIGNMITGGLGKSVMDPSFSGTAGNA